MSVTRGGIVALVFLAVLVAAMMVALALAEPAQALAAWYYGWCWDPYYGWYYGWCWV
jgi:hypothetical protein